MRIQTRIYHFYARLNGFINQCDKTGLSDLPHTGAGGPHTQNVSNALHFVLWLRKKRETQYLINCPLLGQ